MLVKDDEGEKNIVINRPIENRQDGCIFSIKEFFEKVFK
jgi:hypothetical protein